MKKLPTDVVIDNVLGGSNAYLKGVANLTRVQLDYAAYETEKLVYGMYNIIHKNSFQTDGIKKLTMRTLSSKNKKDLQRRLARIKKTSYIHPSLVTPQKRANMYRDFYLQSTDSLNFQPRKIAQIKREMSVVMARYHRNMEDLLDASGKKGYFHSVDTKVREMFEKSEFGDYVPDSKERKKTFDSMYGDGFKDNWESHQQVEKKDWTSIFSLTDESVDETKKNDNIFVEAFATAVTSKVLERGVNVGKSLWNRFHPTGRSGPSSMSTGVLDKDVIRGLDGYRNSGLAFQRNINTNMGNTLQQATKISAKHFETRDNKLYLRWVLHPAHSFMISRADNPEGIDACDVFAGVFHPRYDHELLSSSGKAIPPRYKLGENNYVPAWQEPEPVVNTLNDVELLELKNFAAEQGFNEDDFLAGLYEAEKYPNEPHPNGKCWAEVVVVDMFQGTELPPDDLVSETSTSMLSSFKNIAPNYATAYYAQRIVRRMTRRRRSEFLTSIRKAQGLSDKQRIIELKKQLDIAELNYYKSLLDRNLTNQMNLRFRFYNVFGGADKAKFTKVGKSGTIDVARQTISSKNAKVRGVTYTNRKGITRMAKHFSPNYQDIELIVEDAIGQTIIKHNEVKLSVRKSNSISKNITKNIVKRSKKPGTKGAFSFMERKCARDLTSAKLSNLTTRFKEQAVKWFIHDPAVLERVSPGVYNDLIELGYKKYLR